MRGVAACILFTLLLAGAALAVPSPKTYNGKEYYLVNSAISDEDTGSEVCAKVGKTCIGYTEEGTAVCKLYHPGAQTSSSLSGDRSGVYCDGTPQRNECGQRRDTCHECPACTASVSCGTPIGGLYREMYVECGTGSAPQPSATPPFPAPSGCPVVLAARNTQSFLAEIPSLNGQLQGCPTTLPGGVSTIIGNGAMQLDILMTSGTTESLTVNVAANQVTGISRGAPSRCTQRITIGEADLDAILSSRDRGTAFRTAYGQGKVKVAGCTVIRRFVSFLGGGLSRFLVRRATPPPPPPPPQCAALGDSCNNNGCQSGICAAPYENVNGQWRAVNYRCIDTQQYRSVCIATGNTRAPWDCVTYPCR